MLEIWMGITILSQLCIGKKNNESCQLFINTVILGVKVSLLLWTYLHH